MSAITVDGELVHYEVLGRGGRPVVLLHGWLGSWRYWIPTMRQLQMKHRVYAVDFFGYGDSGKNPARYPIAVQVEMLEVFMKELGIPKAAILGHGLGAQVAIHYNVRYPQRVARMLLASLPLFDPGDLALRVPAGTQRRLTQGGNASPTASDGTRTPVRPSDPTVLSTTRETIANPNFIDREKLRQAADARLGGSAGPSVPNPVDAAARSSGSSPGPNLLAAALNADLETLLGRCFRKTESDYEKLRVDLSKADPNVLLHATRDFDSGLFLDAIRQIEQPLVVVHGENDPLIPAPKDTIWDYLTQNNDSILLPFQMPEVRHFPMLETDTFQRLVGMFLELQDVNQIELKGRWRRRTH